MIACVFSIHKYFIFYICVCCVIVLIPTLSETPLMLPQAESPLWSIFLVYIFLSASYVNAQPVLPKTYIPPFGVNSGFKVTVIDDD